MRLISLNTWGGRIPAIFPFLESKKSSTDIFCFQEVYNNAPDTVSESFGDCRQLFDELGKLLSEYGGYYTPQVEGVGLAMFLRKDIIVDNFRSDVVLSTEDLENMRMPNLRRYYPRVLQSITLKEQNLTVYNFHGVPGGGKRDMPVREVQTRRLLDILEKDTNHKVLVGDLNLSPDTQAIANIERKMENLIKASVFTTTRSSLYENCAITPFADYVFVSPGVAVQDFQVLPNEVSDHLPLLLEFK